MVILVNTVLAQNNNCRSIDYILLFIYKIGAVVIYVSACALRTGGSEFHSQPVQGVSLAGVGVCALCFTCYGLDCLRSIYFLLGMKTFDAEEIFAPNPFKIKLLCFYLGSYIKKKYMNLV